MQEKRRKCTEGVTPSGASHTGATVMDRLSGDARMNRGPKVQHTFSYESLRQADREDILNCTHKISFYMKFSDYVSSYPIYFYMGYFLSVHPVSGHHPIFIARYFSVILHALDVYIERKIED